MAQLPTVYAPTIAQVTAAAKSMLASKTTTSSRVASLDGRVDETTHGLASSNLDMAPFALERELDHQHSDKRQQRQSPKFFELFSLSSRSFSYLLDHENSRKFNTHDQELNSRPTREATSNAIKIYELNAKVIHGEPDVPGTTVSLTL